MPVKTTLLLASGLLMLGATVWYRHEAATAKHKLDKISTQLDSAITQLASAGQHIGQLQTQISDISARNQKLAALDARHTRELASARQQNENLRDAVNRGAKRLHVHATCMPPGTAAAATASAASMDDGKSPRLTENAGQHYFRLREQIKIITAQVNGLQEYISEQCHNKKPEG